MAVLLQYSFDADLTATTVDADVTGSVATNGFLTSLLSDVAGYATQVAIANPASGATSASLAVTNDSYFFISITPDAGKTISLTSLTFDIARGGASTPRGYDVRSSADSYATTLGTADVSTQRTTTTPVTISLAGASFQNQSSSITFRIYIYAPGTGNSLDINNLTINGTVGNGGTLEQEGYRWRLDDGGEVSATWIDSQDVNITKQRSINARLRVLINSTLDRGAEGYQLEFRKVGDTTWTKIT